MTTISAKSILASRHALDPDKRLDTLLLRMPRSILAEFNTHGAIASNAASSRALPTQKIIDDILADPFVPLYWGKNQKGMQADEEINELVPNWDEYEMPLRKKDQMLDRETAWLKMCDTAIRAAEAFSSAGYHKQIVNRLLEPFMHVTVLATAKYQGGWSNFLGLRDHPAAEPHMEMLAKAVRKAIDEAAVQTLQPGEWHLPLVTQGEHNGQSLEMAPNDDRIRLSVARCASTSYRTVDGFDMTIERADDIYSKLCSSDVLHASPFEHQAQADHVRDAIGITNGEQTHFLWKRPTMGGRLGEGWIQLRKTLPNECL